MTNRQREYWKANADLIQPTELEKERQIKQSEELGKEEPQDDSTSEPVLDKSGK